MKSADGHLQEMTTIMHITNMNPVKPILNLINSNIQDALLLKIGVCLGYEFESAKVDVEIEIEYTFPCRLLLPSGASIC
jgi:hypothetical protein